MGIIAEMIIYKGPSMRLMFISHMYVYFSKQKSRIWFVISKLFSSYWPTFWSPCHILCDVFQLLFQSYKNSVHTNDWQIIEKAKFTLWKTFNFDTFESALSLFVSVNTSIRLRVTTDWYKKKERNSISILPDGQYCIHLLFRWLLLTSSKACSVEIEFKHGNRIDKNWSRQKKLRATTLKRRKEKKHTPKDVKTSVYWGH